MSRKDESVESLVARFTVVLERNGEVVVDSTLAAILSGIRRHGSLLAAARALGVPYSRAWEALSRAERLLGVKLVETWRGGTERGGARLTEHAEKLLALYEEAKSSLERCVGPQAPRLPVAGEPDLVVAYSHDPVLELVLERLRDRGYAVEGVCMGSGLSLAMLSLGEAHVACSHLLDLETGSYNRPYLRRYWISDEVLLGGYMREVVVAYRRGLSYSSPDEVFSDVVRGKLRIVNRNRGSGTRILLDHLLEKAARRLGIREPRVSGYEREVYTHAEAAREVALGRADAALVLRSVAEEYGLPWLHVAWERYECYTRSTHAKLKPVAELASTLSSSWLTEVISSKPGYQLLPNGRPAAGSQR
ncbi:MAG: substrate-binding domain-containing protein [Thermoproteota archaeon]